MTSFKATREWPIWATEKRLLCPRLRHEARYCEESFGLRTGPTNTEVFLRGL